MQTQHPHKETLAHYLESPDSSDHGEIRRHLLHCNECRQQIDLLSRLELDIRNHVARTTRHEAISDDELYDVEKYVDGELDGQHAESIRDSLKRDPDALKSALHYATHSAAMSRELKLPAAPAKFGKTPSSSLFASLWSQLKSLIEIPLPAWSMVPASLVIAAIISGILVNNFAETKHGPVITAFQDNASISFRREGIPAGSIGFFHDAQSQSIPFKGMKLALENNTLVMRWDAIESAKNYHLSIFEITQTGKKELVSQESTNNEIRFSSIKLQPLRHYQWLLNGKTGDGMQFETSGDFIYSNAS